MRIRRLAPDDWLAYREIRLRALETDPDAFGATLAEARMRPDEVWRDRLAKRDVATIVVEDDDGTPLGMATGAPAAERPGVAGLYGMWVEPGSRGQGIGMALVRWIQAWAGDAGYATIELGVTTTNGAARRLYERAGFEPTGELHRLRDDGDLEFEMMAMSLAGPAESADS